MGYKTYKDLPLGEEMELVLWLTYLEESLKNAETQIKRWNRLKNSWELEAFFNVVVCIDNAIKGLKKFLNYGKDYCNESELWAILKSFRKEVRTYNIRALRNDLVHRENIFQLKDKEGKPFPRCSVLILSCYNFSTGEYQFGSHLIKVSEIFLKTRKLRKDIKKIFKEKLSNFHTDMSNNYKSMIPFGLLRGFCEKSGGFVWTRKKLREKGLLKNK